MGRRALLTSLVQAARLALALLCACLAGPLTAKAPDSVGEPRWGQFSDLIFRHFTTDTGLPFTGATAIAQDHFGFLWIGSQNGLARWDGQRFRLYQAADRRSGLRDNLIKVLHVDRQGRLWVGTNAGGIARFDPATDRFIPYSVGPHGISHAGVGAIADDGRGGIWVGTSGGLDRIDPDARTVRHYRHRADDPASLPADKVSALLPATGGGLWVGTSAGLSRLDATTARFQRIALPPGGKQPGVTTLAGCAGKLCIGTVGAGAFTYDPTRATVVPVVERDGRGSPLATQPLATQTITGIAEARPGEVWIATSSRGVVIVDGGFTRRIIHDASMRSSLADDAPVALFRDRAGVMWVGTQRALSRTDPTRTGVWTMPGGTQRPGAVSDQDITAVHAGADGRVWLGLGSKGVDILDTSRGRVTRLAANAQVSLPAVSVEAFAELPDGRVAIGTHAGLFVSDPAGTTLAPLGLGGGGRSREVTALLRDGKTLWIGRLDGLWRLTIDGLHPAAPVRMAESDRLGDQRVMSIAQARDGALWIGTQNGLNRLMPASGTVERTALSSSGSDGLVPTVLADQQGRIWAGVYGRGIALIAPSRGRAAAIRYIGVAQGLPDANVDMLIEDGIGRIWASTDDGLAVVGASGSPVRALRDRDGVAIAANWNGSGARMPTGQMLFGGLGGLTVVDPRTVAAPAPPAPLVATELRVGGQAMSADRFNDGDAHAKVTITPRANSLFLEFATLDYGYPNATHYRYRLRGYQDDWTDADAAHRSVSFTNLPPGRYVLEVRAGDAASRLNRLDVPVTVLAAWYQTWWFKLGLGLLALGAMAAVIQLRTAVLKRRQRELERLVAERTMALRASQRELERIAYVDVLTGLPNRRMFNDAFRSAIERANDRNSSLALLLIDLDHFKAINDTHGHDAGDVLLSEVALALRAEVGGGDSLARLGGDEFAVIVQDANDIAPVDDLCRRIVATAARPVSFAGADLQSGATIGVALYKKHGATPAELYKASDVALYAAKKKCRGSWTWYGTDLVTATPSLETSTSRRSLR